MLTSFFASSLLIFYVVMLLLLLLTVYVKNKRRIESLYFLALTNASLGFALSFTLYSLVGYHTQRGFNRMVLIPALLFMLCGVAYTLLNKLTQNPDRDRTPHH
jgi:hypothetical protein